MAKHTGLKRFLIAFGALIIVVGGVFGVFVINGTCNYTYSLSNETNKCWMKYLKDDTKVNEIVVPGSHDAGTKGMFYAYETQYTSIKEELYSGVRYFDLRVNKVKDDKLVMFHASSNGTEFLPILEDIKEYLVNFPTETLYLDFQHFNNDSEELVKKAIISTLYDNNLLVTKDLSSSLTSLAYISNLTLGEVRGKCMVFWGNREDTTIYKDKEYLFLRNDDTCTYKSMSLNSCYVSSYNKKKSEEYIKVGLPYYFNNIKEKISNEGYKGIFVLQGQLTDGLLLRGPFYNEKRHNDNMNNYIINLKDNKEYLRLTNVIMRDFIDETKANYIIALNYYKDNVNNDYVSAFTKDYL